MIYTIFHGFCMALADSVPGVSGGTVAYILGFYERFIEALHDFFSGSMRDRKNALRYLLKLGLGWLIGMVSSVLVLAQLFESHIYFLTSLFMGLTLAALPFVYKEERAEIVGHGRNVIFFIIGLALVCGMVMVRGDLAASATVNFQALSLGAAAYVFISGALAISAMVLPGVSGSTVLLIMGVYLPTISALNRLAHLDTSVLLGVLVLIFGILCGAAVAVRFLRAALKHHRSAVVYLILGLMLGSLYAIYMGPTTLAEGTAPLSAETFSPLAFILGIAILFGLEKIKAMGQRREAEMQELMKK
ncbi:MAG: DUF368 domain-containing protein [Peptococcaceae bacterium]|nr:DUF368 domain-containing protein [Peptococcaceae bacterium]